MSVNVKKCKKHKTVKMRKTVTKSEKKNRKHPEKSAFQVKHFASQVKKCL